MRASPPQLTPREALFATARCAGWIAHAIEQGQTGALIRPRARYVGVEVA
ncbi:citrate/2-methylcitrate synthase [Phenylobacterium sp.]